MGSGLYKVTAQKFGVGIATGLDGPGSNPGSARFLSSPQRPDRFWGSPSLLSNGYRGLFSRGYSGRGVKLTTHLHLVPRSRMVAIHPLPHMSPWRSA
jgi:hypothetical protein